MKIKAAFLSTVTIELFILGSLAGFCCGELQIGFYEGKCGFEDVEAIVAGVVTSQFLTDPTIVAALLRMQFHDCFVNGCDASILLDGINGEKMAPANLNVRGYEIIDQAKDAVEKACPGVVSCADLIAIATRDAVFLVNPSLLQVVNDYAAAITDGKSKWQGGGGRYEVQTGRRDGLLSVAENVTIPFPSASIFHAIAAFANKGLSITDMVILLGAHSVGVAHCSLFKDRLYNFQGTGEPDPSMDPFLLNILRTRCPKNAVAVDNTVNLDQNPFSPFILDVSYYRNIMLHRGILQIDQELGMDPLTQHIVKNLTTSASAFDFPAQFGGAMVKLGAVDVLTGHQGEIRRSCRVTNGFQLT